jgi:protein-disulfide isomerase
MRARHALWLLVFALLTACGAGNPSPPEPPRVELATALVAASPPAEGSAQVSARGAAAEVPWEVAPGTFLPVGAADPSWGDQAAPVTFVVFGDFQCPFTKRHMANVEELQKRYGPEVLRVVWKDYPLPFHARARPAALAAETVFRLGGPPAFWAYHHLLFENQRALEDADLLAYARAVGVDFAEFRAAYESERYVAALDEDLQRVHQVGASGTPRHLREWHAPLWARPMEDLIAAVDRARGEATAALRSGTPVGRIYAELSDKHGAERPPPAPAAPSVPTAPKQPTLRDDDSLVWSVPVKGSPARGGKAALVTLVVFSDLQCPFCSRVEPTLDALAQQYGDKLRIVWKHTPLPFHPRAEPAAELAMEARAQKGDAAFWAAVDLLFANQRQLEDADLWSYAQSLGLDVPRAQKAVSNKLHRAAIEADLLLAEDVLASGTPHFFINGRRLVGAQPKERFVAMIDQELAKAQKLVASGTPVAKIYDLLVKNGRKAAPLDRVVLPAPAAKSPGKGAKPGAKVVIQMFADFQCPFCKRVQPVLDELIAAYPGKVRVVFRHQPLPMHTDAALAAEAAVEAHRQKGDAGFWALGDLLFAAQGGVGLARPELDAAARQLGLDMVAFADALDRRVHRATVEADSQLASSVGITGTPAFAINDYYLSGSQPLAKFKHLVDKALGPAEPIDPAAKVYRVAPTP